MPTIDLALTDGRTVPIEVPERGAGPSCFLLGLPKAGSTLFYRIMRPLAIRAGLAYFSIPNALDALGLPFAAVAGGLDSAFEPHGYAYGGFRGIDPALSIPAFASGRTILLVRDPRDMVTSLYFSEAFSHQAPGTIASEALAKAFDARRAAALAETIDDFAIRRARGILVTFETTSRKLDTIEHRIDRYEDVIFRKREWIAEIVAHLGLDVPDDAVRAIVARNDIAPDTEDVTQHIRRVAPGDHRDKLKPATIERLDEIFAPLLGRFGYDQMVAPTPSRGAAAELARQRDRLGKWQSDAVEARRAERRAARKAARGQGPAN